MSALYKTFKFFMKFLYELTITVLNARNILRLKYCNNNNLSWR